MKLVHSGSHFDMSVSRGLLPDLKSPLNQSFNMVLECSMLHGGTFSWIKCKLRT